MSNIPFHLLIVHFPSSFLCTFMVTRVTWKQNKAPCHVTLKYPLSLPEGESTICLTSFLFLQFLGFFDKPNAVEITQHLWPCPVSPQHTHANQHTPINHTLLSVRCQCPKVPQLLLKTDHLHLRAHVHGKVNPNKEPFCELSHLS